MKVSRFTIRVPDFPGIGKYLIFNTRTQAQVVIDDELARALESLPDGQSSAKTTDAMSTLKELGLLVDDGVDEDRVIEEWFRGLQTAQTVLKPTVLTTYACNFSCTYCVEQGVHHPVFMDSQTAQHTISYIRAQAARLHSSRILCTFYGGEPLLNIPAIREVALGIGKIAAELGIPYAFGITTNGSLLTRAVVEELKALGLRGAKLTLDGTRETHDGKRPFVDGKGSFDVIMKNLLECIDLISIDIGGNFDDRSFDDIPPLLDHLSGLGLKRKLHKVSFKPICPGFMGRRRLGPAVEMECAYGGIENAGKIMELRRIAREKGFPVDEGVDVHICGAAMGEGGFCVDPTGILYRCPGFVGHARFSTGDISHGERPGTSIESWKSCTGCAYVPLCGGGCSYDAYVRYGDAHRLSCYLESMEYMVREALKEDYLRSHAG
jgi:uncharacterized protein